MNNDLAKTMPKKWGRCLDVVPIVLIILWIIWIIFSYCVWKEFSGLLKCCVSDNSYRESVCKILGWVMPICIVCWLAATVVFPVYVAEYMHRMYRDSIMDYTRSLNRAVKQQQPDYKDETPKQ